MRYATLCSGIDGFGCGFDQVPGFECVYQCEQDAKCREVLEVHYPGIPRGTDVNDESVAAELVRLRPELLAFGFPCQDLSVAGNRAGLAGERSGLFFRCMFLAHACAAGWVLIENVPGLLSSNGGRDMGTVLWTLGQFGYRWAHRVLDAQYSNLAQRRERVFIVGSLGDRPHPAQILFEPESVCRDHPPRRQEKSRVAATITSGVAAGSGVNRPGRRREDDVNIVVNALDCQGGGPDDGAAQAGHLIAYGCNDTRGPIDIATACNAHSGRQDFESETFVVQDVACTLPASDGGVSSGYHPMVVHSLTGEGADASDDGTGRGTPLVVTPFDTGHITSAENRANPQSGDPCHPISSTGHPPAIAFQERGRDGGRSCESQEELAYSLNAANGGGRRQENCIAATSTVRRLTPKECERLMGFPEIERRIIFELCSELQKISVDAESQNLKSLSHVGNVAKNETLSSVQYAGLHFQSSDQKNSKHALSDVCIFCEERAVAFHSQGKLRWSANVAESPSSCPQFIEVESFARHLAIISLTAAQITQIGKEELPQSERLLIHHLNGRVPVSLCGPEITQLVRNAFGDSTTKKNHTKFTISSHSHLSNCERNFLTSLSYVLDATIGCIPEKMCSESSLRIEIVLRGGYTRFDSHGKQISDSARYRMLGNSVAVPVAKWIAGRIALAIGGAA